MNSRAERTGTLAPGEVARRLRREGIACAEGGVPLTEQSRKPEATGQSERQANPPAFGRGAQGAERRFTVTVFDVEATDVRRLYPDGGGLTIRRGQAEPDDRLRRIVSRASVRALYVLGLPHGQVEVSTDEAGKPAIIRLSKQMNPSSEEGAWRTRLAMEERSAALAAESARTIEAVLGADPEFVLQAPNGKVVPASRYLPPGGLAGCDSVVRRGVRVWPLVELRPDPDREPAEIVASIRRLLARAARRIERAGAAAPPLRWRAGAWPVPGLPLGGHIHISGAALTGERLRALDNAVALPLRLLEPPGAAGRRPRYGALGDFRRQSHGGFEYRTPPSWLVSRRLALGALSLAKIAAEQAGALAGSRPLDDDALRDAFYAPVSERSAGLEALREAALTFYDKLQKLDGYRRYAAEIDYVFESIRARRHWDESADIRRKWGIPLDSAPPVK